MPGNLGTLKSGLPLFPSAYRWGAVVAARGQGHPHDLPDPGGRIPWGEEVESPLAVYWPLWGVAAVVPVWQLLLVVVALVVCLDLAVLPLARRAVAEVRFLLAVCWERFWLWVPLAVLSWEELGVVLAWLLRLGLVSRPVWFLGLV